VSIFPGRLLALIENSRDPETMYRALRSRVSYQTVLSNLGRFSGFRSSAQPRLRGLYPILNAEPGAVASTATVAGRMFVTATSSRAEEALVFERAWKLLRAMTLEI
jgi:hypothetical protein